jgi:anti-sigma factor RsiW
MAIMRHLVMDELLALRDGEGSAFARSHVESCEACRGELERLYQVRSKLRAMPTFGPPRELWPRIRQHVLRRRMRKRLGLRAIGLAAAAALAGFVILRGPGVEPAADAADVWVAEATSEDLGPVINRARQLETLLQVYAPQRRVYDAPTALATSVLEDRIGVLDQILLESRALGADREVLRGLWGERVDALEQLVNLQVAQEEKRVWR